MLHIKLVGKFAYVNFTILVFHKNVYCTYRYSGQKLKKNTMNFLQTKQCQGKISFSKPHQWMNNIKNNYDNDNPLS